MSSIHLWGVRQNNLKSIEVKIPLGSFTVVCGPSGSGKSSLAFQTLYAEGQRRYIESLSNYSKQFLNKAPKPDLDGIENVPPALALEQKNSVKNSRSTVGTTTEVLDYLRLLYEKLGTAFCPDHNLPLEAESPSRAAAKTVSHLSGRRAYVLFPIGARDRVANGKKLYELLKADGFLRIYVPVLAKTRKTKARTADKSKVRPAAGLQAFAQVEMGEVVELSSVSAVPEQDFYVVVDRTVIALDEQSRLADSLSQAFKQSVKYNKALNEQQAIVLTTEGERLFLSEAVSCSRCGYSFPKIDQRLFSFNSPVGACEGCKGFGNRLELDINKVVPNPRLSLAQGALKPFAMPSASQDRKALLSYCRKNAIDINLPWQDLPSETRDIIWRGNQEFYGVHGLFEYLETKKYKMHVRVFLARFKTAFTCSVCHGSRLKPIADLVKIAGHSISELCQKPIAELCSFFAQLELTPSQREVAQEVFRQLRARLDFLNQVGVGYLTLDRTTRSLSGGEFQRLNLSNQLGMGLSQTLYVLDEPTVGLHPRDNDRLIGVLKELQGLGNTLVIVEHDYDVIKNADHVIEMGPGSGHLGGEVMFAGTYDDFIRFPESNTAGFLTNQMHTSGLTVPRPVDLGRLKYKLELKGCTANNLKNVHLALPLNRMTTVTGVSGSGKSTLIGHTLYPALARALGMDEAVGGDYEELIGVEQIKNLLFIDQTPIGKTARSNPVTYLKVFDSIRQIMAATALAKRNGLTPGDFSLNVEGGRCPVCQGLGHEVIDMMFMDDIELTCEACDGKKYLPDVLAVRYKNKNIHEILNMTVQEAMDFFVAYPNIRRPLSVLRDVGLEYLRLGQNASSLSGGESQRLKIAKELEQAGQKSTLYILDEPTTGLHFREVHLLLKVLNRLVEAGGTVVVVEHNLEVIRHSDWLIDMGPEAGHGGGQIVDQGSPLDLVSHGTGFTAQYLRAYEQAHSPVMSSLQ